MGGATSVSALVVWALLFSAIDNFAQAEITDFDSLKAAFLKLVQRVDSLEQNQRLVCERGVSARTSEPYLILRDDTLARDIRCDTQTDGGGWIVFQRRDSGTLDFDRPWSEYRNGFGDLNSEFWLGNEALHWLTKDYKYEMQADIRTMDGREMYNVYGSFRVDSDKPFSTKDRDNDNHEDNCASSGMGGFWFDGCTYVLPNSVWTYKFWNTGQFVYFPTLFEFKIRRVPI
ncbi:hypothetical protein EGW08_019523 [Elysia chlorotica]|uniref:Fibrinogen C-terminal domain-containing protein n=1 Tax=Elysia chlorotica TaxID=188477 RepID=A0A433STZ9_ELYCH|nr:hypothetical protein EGW08_019523 [Elysia chlorotica]